MQQSSATPSLHLDFLGVAEDCCMLSILLAVPSCTYSFWHSVTVIPTSYDFYTCNTKGLAPFCDYGTVPCIPRDNMASKQVFSYSACYTEYVALSIRIERVVMTPYMVMFKCCSRHANRLTMSVQGPGCECDWLMY